MLTVSTRSSHDLAAAQAYVRAGKWPNKTLFDYAMRHLERGPEQIAIVDGSLQLTRAEIIREARLLLAGLHHLGLKSGATVSFQLPNWWEAAVINLACSMGGLICNPIVPIYRAREVSFILQDSEAEVIFVPEVWRNFNYLEMIEELQQQLPQLKNIVVVRGGSPDELTWRDMVGKYGEGELVLPAADDIKLLLYTSGTTGRAKGVLHSHNTIAAELKAVTEFWHVTENDIILAPSPITHISGYLFGLELPLLTGSKVVFMERWDPNDAIQLASSHTINLTVAATPFLSELCHSLNQQATTLPHWRLFACGGAPVAEEQIQLAARVLPNSLICRVYGATEAPTVTLGINNAEDRFIGASTDGRIVNTEVEVRDVITGEPVADGLQGQIFVRGPEVMLGYTDSAETLKAIDMAGFFDTGDLGVRSHGCITVTGRKKDIIIRGGENISPKEIEDLIGSMRGVREVAVVAIPHPRLGETACAIVVLDGSTNLTLADVTAFLNNAKLARQKIPERLEIQESLPKTPAGKVMKHVLRENLRNVTN